jgi:hypothetical protein
MRTTVKHLWALALCGAFAVAPGLSYAQALLNPELDAKISAEQLALFKSFCIEAYPDEAATEKSVMTHGATALTPDGVKVYLHDDPGKGWRFETPLGLYVLTLEQPPVRACALRRMTRSGAVDARGLNAAIAAYAQGRNATVMKPMVVPMTSTLPSVVAYGFIVQDATGKPDEQFVLITSNYHHQPPAEFAKDAEGGVGVEVRMVHQPIGNRP